MSVISLFSITSLIAHHYEPALQSFALRDSAVGMSAYVSLTASAIVIAPVSTLPLIPLAAVTWGWVTAALLSIIGWTIGSQLAFWLARRYGKTLVQTFISLERFTGFEQRFTGRNLFWMVVLLRMTIPVDILSYALGLFSQMSHRSFFGATIIGIIPFAFVFAYLGSLPPQIQIIGLIEIAIVIIIIYFFWTPEKHPSPNDQ